MSVETKEFAMFESRLSSRITRLGTHALATASVMVLGMSMAAHGQLVGSLPGGVVTPLPIPGGGVIGPIIVGGGGTYEGPGDTVPPGSGNGNIGMCTMNLPPVVCDTDPACDLGWYWTPDDPRCVWPKFGPPTTDQLYAQGFMLTIGDVMEMFQQGNACIDVYGNITACIAAPFDVHEVHVFQSGWINGYNNNAPIAEAVSTTVCVDGDLLMSGWSFEEIAQARPCDSPAVCVSFNAQCLFAAMQDWSQSGVDLSQWSNAWLFYVDFVSCMPCEG
ncbi:MAG TPA: hypothetical protein DEO92_04050 [Phycisphaerales bacterium]|jgi:hypothetical protein|nr:hypothetical protein [Phycisphaerales bacterium]|tara:strand:- start:98 stop:922 length:825 start_codon:yes stop_codon:yes gene_type:complete